MTEALATVVRIHPLRPPLASPPAVREPFRAWLDARRLALTTKAEEHAIAALEALTVYLTAKMANGERRAA